MMEKFRNLSNNIFFKIFLSLLGLSFILWGVNGFIMNSPNAWIAKVGNKKIAYSEFIKSQQDTREIIYRSNPGKEAMQYLDSAQFKNDVLNKLIISKLLDNVSEYYGIYPDKDLVLKEIINQPNFKDEKGNFNRIAFVNYLKINNLTEDKIIADISRDVVNKILVTSLFYEPIKNDVLAKEILKYRNQERVADVITLTFSDLKQVQAPTQKELEEFFKQNQSGYTVPEFRAISYLEFSKKDLASKAEVSDAEINSYYQSNGAFLKPSSRDFYHIVFEDKKNADDFYAKLEAESKKSNDKEKVFLDLASKVQNRQKAEFKVSGMMKKNLLPEIANDAFTLNVGEYSKILHSPLGYHVFFLIKEHEPQREELNAKLKSEIKERLEVQKQEELVNKKVEEIDDNILTSNSLEKVAKQFNLNVQKLDFVNQNGLGKNKENLAEKVKLDDFIKNSFALAKNQASELFYSKSNDKYYAIFVNNIEASRTMSLNEVKPSVIESFINRKKQENLEKMAFDLHKKFSAKNANIEKIASDNGLKITKNKIFHRSYEVDMDGSTIDYANEFVTDLFSINLGEFTKPHSIARNEIHIGILKNITKKDPTKEEVDLMAKSLSDQYKKQILERYDNYLQNKFSIQINNKLMNSNQVEQ